jgi:hypothetical protein
VIAFRTGLAYGNTFDLVDHHRRTIYSELERPPVIARQRGIGAPAPEGWLAKRPSTDRRIGATDEFREGTESAETTTSGVAAVEPPNLRRFR